jgi:hypothetical protein
MNTFEKGFQSPEESNEDHTELFEKLETWYDDHQPRTASELIIRGSTVIEEA